MQLPTVCAVIAAIFLSAISAGCGKLETDPHASTAVDSLRAEIEAEAIKHAGEHAAMASRLAALEAAAKVPAQAAPQKKEAAGSWIIWQSRKVGHNPRGLFVSPAEPKPMFAYDSQAECMEVAERNAKELGGDPERQQYAEAGRMDLVWTVTLTCLPKGVDPR